MRTATQVLSELDSALHQMTVIAVPDGHVSDFYVVCSCRKWATSAFTTLRSAQARAGQPCGVELEELQGAKYLAELARRLPAPRA